MNPRGLAAGLLALLLALSGCATANPQAGGRTYLQSNGLPVN